MRLESDSHPPRTARTNMRHYCVVPGCEAPGRHAFTLRIRRPDASAIAAPNTNAWLCDEHAESGLEIDIQLKPTASRTITTFTWAEQLGESGHIEKSVTQITGAAARPREADKNGATRSIARPDTRRRGAVR